MKTTLIATMATVLFPAWFACTVTKTESAAAPGLRAEEGHHADVRDIAGRAKYSLREAITKALAAQPGRAVEADLEGEYDDEKLDVFYEVLVLTAENELVEVRLDPQSGEVREREEAEGDEDEIPGFQAALRHSEHDLGKLVEAAEGFVKGAAVSASLEYEHEMPVCNVAFVHSRYVLEVEVEGRAAHLIDVELRKEKVGHDHDDGDEEEEGGEHGEEHEGAEMGEEHEGGKKQGAEEEEEEGEEHEAKPSSKPAVEIRRAR